MKTVLYSLGLLITRQTSVSIILPFYLIPNIIAVSTLTMWFNNAGKLSNVTFGHYAVAH